MFVKAYGTGEKPFVAFHGWSGDHRTFDPLVPYLPQNSSLYCFDLPGCGKSPLPGNWELETFASILADSITSLKLPPFTFIGNCSGAILGLMTAKKIPDKFEHIVLIDPFAFMPWYLSIFLNKYFGRQAYMTTFANPIGRWITNASLRHRRTEKTDLTKSFEEVNHQTVYEYLRLMDKVGNAERFKGLAQPIDLLYGKNSFQAVKDSIPIWKKIFSQANSYELQGAGHLPIEEATEQIAKIIFNVNKDT